MVLALPNIVPSSNASGAWQQCKQTWLPPQLCLIVATIGAQTTWCDAAMRCVLTQRIDTMSMTEAFAEMSKEAMLAKIAALETKLAAATKPRKLTMKVSDKGAISVYGFGKWPITLYRQQMERLLDSADDIRAFIVANADNLSVKD